MDYAVAIKNKHRDFIRERGIDAMINNLKVTKGTVVRTISIALVLLNILLKALGFHTVKVDETSLYSFVENLASIGVIALGFWKNNSFTDKAKAADFYLAKLRAFDTVEADELLSGEEE